MNKFKELNVAYFTSMDQDYYDHCGKAMIHSFAHNMKDAKLNIYNEGWFVPKENNKSVHLRGWALGLDYNRFVRRWKKEKRVVQFSKKGFSIIKAMEEIKADRLVWLDADTIVKKHIPMQLINLMCPDDTLSAHFMVKHTKDKKDFFSCETGFFVLNTQHPHFKTFYNTYSRIYKNDENENLRRFYDGEVYGATIMEIEKTTDARLMDLNPAWHKTPISRSIVSPYIEHFKAGVKEGHTNETIIQKYLSNTPEEDYED